MIELIAHRGACFDAPENSLEAFRIAAEEGALRWEIDVQLSADGVPVVFHDRSTGRVTDQDIELEFASFAELRRCHLANGEPIPTLEEVCTLAVSLACTLDVELKTTSAEAVRTTLDCLTRTGALRDVLITSFDPETLRAARVAGFDGTTGLLVGSPSLNIRQRAYEAWPIAMLEASRATALVIHWRLSHRVLQRALRRSGHPLLVWTAVEDERKPEEERLRMYERIARMAPAGAIVGRIREADAVFRQHQARRLTGAHPAEAEMETPADGEASADDGEAARDP